MKLLMIMMIIFFLIVVNVFALPVLESLTSKVRDSQKTPTNTGIKFAKRNSNNIRVQTIVNDLLTFSKNTQFCGEDIYYVLIKFCSYFGGLYYSYKRSDGFGIVDECCYRACNGDNTIRYCDRPHDKFKYLSSKDNVNNNNYKYLTDNQ